MKKIDKERCMGCRAYVSVCPDGIKMIDGNVK